MTSKILSYGIVIVLLVTLIGGTICILVQPTEAQAERGLSREASAQAGGGYRGGERDAIETSAPISRGSGSQSAGGAYGGGQGVGSGQAAAEAEPHDWLTVQGTVLVADSELTVQTAEGDIVVGMGQAWYREEAGFVVNVGDEVVVQGYYEDGEFKAGAVDNRTTGATVTLRDATGRPMWAGRGNGRNR